MSLDDKQCLLNYDFVPPPDEILIYQNMKSEILGNYASQIKKKVTGQKEKACIDAIMMVFKNVDESRFFK